MAPPHRFAELSAHVSRRRQDHNGFSHQDPGFIDHVVNKKAEVVRVYLPPDANTLLSITDHCLKSRNYVNVIDLMALQPPTEHPHGLPDHEYDSLFTKDKPIIFNYHGYPWLIHRLTYRRANQQLHVRG
jgi:phosphoketolase